jgi:hypothetical protein
MKKIISSIMIALVLCLTLVSAYTVTTTNEQPADTSSYPMDNVIGRLFSSLGYTGEFTGYGKALECTNYPVEQKVFTKDTTLQKLIQFTPLNDVATITGVRLSSETVTGLEVLLKMDIMQTIQQLLNQDNIWEKYS